MTNKLTDITNTTVSNNSKSEEITLEKIQEAAKILNDLPPVPICLKCSSITWQALKEGTHELITSGLLDSFFGIRVECKYSLTDNQLEVNYNDGTTKILKIKD